MKFSKYIRPIVILIFSIALSEVAAIGAQERKDEQTLVQGLSLEREIKGGEVHAYKTSLASGQYLQAVVFERGINLSVTVFNPAGERLFDIDGTEGRQGVEKIFLVSEAQGDYRLAVRAVDKDSPAGKYLLKIEELRAAAPADNLKADAERAFAEAAKLNLQRNEKSRREAAEKYKKAADLYRELGDREFEAVALNNLAGIYGFLAENSKALECYKRALELRRAVGDRKGEAITLNNMGLFRQNLSEFVEALEHINQSLKIRREVKDRRGEAICLNNIALIYSNLSEYGKALEYYNQSLPIRREVKDQQGESTVLSGIGYAYTRLGEYGKAIEYYNQALAIVRSLKNVQSEAAILNNIGKHYFDLGDYEKALEYYSLSLAKRREVGDRRGESNSLSGLANVYLKLGDLQKALEQHKSALSIRMETKDRQGAAMALGNIGKIQTQMGENEKALEYHTESIRLFRAIGDRRNEAISLNNIGGTYKALGETEKALETFEQSLQLARSFGDRPGESLVLANIAALKLKSGNLKEARDNIKSALGIVESLRLNIANSELRTSYFASKADYYELYIEILMELHKRDPDQGYDAAALEAAERARARSLLESLLEANADIRRGADTLLLERSRDLQIRINAKDQERVALLSGKPNEESAAKVKKQLDDLLAEYDEIQAQIKIKSPQYAALTQPQPINIKEIRQLLDDDVVLLEYSLGRDRSYLWAVTSSALYSYELPKREEIETQARIVYELLIASRKRESKRQAELAAAQLSEILLRPAAPLLVNKRLLIAADGALHYVPFGALPAPVKSEVGSRKKAIRKLQTSDLRPPTSDFRPLIVDHEIISLPSASVLALLRNESLGRKPAEKTVAVFADPVLQRDDPRLKGAVKDQAPMTANLTRSASDAGWDRLERLQYTRFEAESITGLSSAGESLKALDFEASLEAATKTDLEKYRIIHFATHGILNSRHPELSGIVLSLVNEKGEPKDGFLRAHEVYNMRLNADLVVLSACRTALGKEIKGEGLISLVRGFMYAGASKVAASLWDVRDESTAELMKRFYEGMLKDKLKPAEALRRAQVGMLKDKRWEAPYYWAAFQIQGDWR